MGKVPTKKTSGRKQARPEFDEDAQWTEEYLNQFTIAILKDVTKRLKIPVNGRLKADFIQAMIDYRSPEQHKEDESASRPEAPQTKRSKRKRDVAESDNEENDERANKQPRRGKRRAAAKSKYAEPLSDEEEQDGEEQQRAPPPHTPARHNEHNVSSPPPRPHRPKRKSIARRPSPTPGDSSDDESRRGSLSSRHAFSPELLARDPSPEFIPLMILGREASVERVLGPSGRVGPRPTLLRRPREADDEAAEAHAEEPAASHPRVEPRPTVLGQSHEASDGGNDAEAPAVPENHVEPRPTVLSRPQEALDAADATLQAESSEEEEESDEEMDPDEVPEAELNKFFTEQNKALLQGHLALSRVNATYLTARAMHNEMADDIEFISRMRHAAGVQATLLKREGRRFPLERFSNRR